MYVKCYHFTKLTYLYCKTKQTRIEIQKVSKYVVQNKKNPHELEKNKKGIPVQVAGLTGWQLAAIVG